MSSKQFLRHLLSPKQYRAGRRLFRTITNLPVKMSYLLASWEWHQNENCDRIRALYNKHQKERCFIIGNGPSLNEMDLSLMRDDITFAFNAFYLAFNRIDFMPTYYCVTDRLPAEDNADVLNGLEGTIKVFPHDLRYCLKPTPNTIYVFFDRYYLDRTSAQFPWFSKDLVQCAFAGNTVAYLALQAAYYMGIQEVYLIGVDLSYQLPDEERDYHKNPVIVSSGEDPNHFDSAYFGRGKRWHYPDVDTMAKSFAKAGEVFAANGRKVYNATVGGNLEALPRVHYKELF